VQATPFYALPFIVAQVSGAPYADTLGIAHPMTTTASKILAAVIASLVISEVGCSRSPTHGVGQSPVATARRILPADKAAQLAAKLANDQCDRQYRKRPFSVAQFPSAPPANATLRWANTARNSANFAC
jgi:hypothetical protein